MATGEMLKTLQTNNSAAANLQGEITHWSDRGFGFIARDDAGPRVFVHFSALPSGFERLNRGQRVAVDLVPGRDGRLCATNGEIRWRITACAF